MCLGYYMPAFIIQFQIPNSQNLSFPSSPTPIRKPK